MKKIAIALLGALSLTACSLDGGGVNSAPAPLEATKIDDRGLEAAWRAFDVALDAINLLGDQGVIVPGSARGVAVASGIRKVNSALKAAEAFAKAGSSRSYATALATAKEGMVEIRNAMRSN